MKANSFLKAIMCAATIGLSSISSFAQGITDKDFGYKFALKLYQVIDKMEEGNIALSPVSAEISLASLHNGTTGETLQELKRALGTEEYTIEEVNLYNQALIKALKKNVELTEGDLEGYFFNEFAAPKIAVTNSIWNNSTHKVQYEFWNPAYNYYLAALHSNFFEKEDIEKTINFWISQQTNDWVPSIDYDIDNDAPMYLVNALAFQGRWLEDFVEEYPEEGIFTNSDNSTTSVDYMHLLKKYTISQTDAFDMVKMYFVPNSSHRFSMNIYLPKYDGSIFDYEEYMKLRNNECEKYVKLYLPEFSISNQLMLKDVFRGLGVNGVFEPNNQDLIDWKYIKYGDVYVSEILHPCRVQINALGSQIDKYIDHWPHQITSAKENLTLRFDHPFYYTIEDNENNVILLMGRVNTLGSNDGDSDISYPSFIETPITEEFNPATYDLSGRSVSNTKAHGIYIANGRKVIR